MARVVLGLATSHSPNVSTVPELWKLHAERDRRNPKLDFAGLVAVAPAGLEKELTPDVFQAKHDLCQASIEQLRQRLVGSKIDVVVVIGDDQRELFLDECQPTFAVYTGADLIDIPPPPEKVDPSHKPALWARHAEDVERYALQPAFATHIATALCRDGIDIAAARTQYEGRSLGHAFTFVRLRMMGSEPIPMVPIFINTYFPPNQPTPGRCWDFGAALGRAIASWPEDLRVAVVASGGLSHFVIDEALDRRVLEGVEKGSREILSSLPMEKLDSGNSEIRNWIAASACMSHLKAEVLAYTPAYRSEAGTGCGMAFAVWE